MAMHGNQTKKEAV